MSPADAKRGAKRRKNKRGGGSSSSGSSSGSNSSAAGDVKAAAALRGQHSAPGGGAGSAAGAGLIPGSSTTPPGTEIALNGTPFTDGPLSSDFTGVPQAPFTFGLGQRAPYTTGEHCLLCRSERKDLTLSECGTKKLKQTSTFHISKSQCQDAPSLVGMLRLPADGRK